MMTKTIVDTPRIETTACAARLRRKRAMPGGPDRALLPPHLGDEERLVRRRLPLELTPGPVDGEVLVEADARDVLLEDRKRLAVVPEALLVLQGLASMSLRLTVSTMNWPSPLGSILAGRHPATSPRSRDLQFL